MEDYESKHFIAKTENITLGELLDIWSEEELKTGTLSNGTVENYLQAIGRIKQHPLSRRKLKTVTSEHLQQFMDLMVFGGKEEDFVSKGYSKDYVHSFSAVLQQSFRFAVFPKKFITFNPMQYVVIKKKNENVDLFTEKNEDDGSTKPLTPELYRKLMDYLEEQYLTVRRSVRYNSARHKTEIGPTKRKKVRIVDFGDTLADILKKAKKEQHKQRFQYGELYQRN